MSGKTQQFDWTGNPINEVISTNYISFALPELNVDEIWYIKYPGDISLYEATIMEITEKTVLLQTDDCVMKGFLQTRYKKTDIEFVEKRAILKND